MTIHYNPLHALRAQIEKERVKGTHGRRTLAGRYKTPLAEQEVFEEMRAANERHGFQSQKEREQWQKVKDVKKAKRLSGCYYRPKAKITLPKVKLIDDEDIQ